MNAQTPILAVRRLRIVRGGREVLRVDDLGMPEGEILALVGPNGAGKSTLVQTFALLLRPAAGRVEVFGRPVQWKRGLVRLRREMAVVLQDPALLDMTVRQNVELPMRLRGVTRRDRRHSAATWLERLGVGHLAGARVHTLSGGEAQRVNLARAFAVAPRLLLLDEPFAGLDVPTKQRLLGEVADLLAELGTTAVLATHDYMEAQLLAHRTAVLLDGRLVQLGPTHEVFQTPATPAVAALFGQNVIQGHTRAHAGATVARFGALELPAAELRPGRRLVAALPPDAIRVALDGEPNRLEARIVAVGAAQGRARITVDVGVRLTLELPPHEVDRLEVRRGRALPIVVDSSRIRWFMEGQ